MLTHTCDPASLPVLGPEAQGHTFTIGGTIQSQKTQQYLNIAEASTSYKPLVWGAKGDTTAWGLEGDTIITVQGSSYGRRKLMFFPYFLENGFWILDFFGVGVILTFWNRAELVGL